MIYLLSGKFYKLVDVLFNDFEAGTPESRIPDIDADACGYIRHGCGTAGAEQFAVILRKGGPLFQVLRKDAFTEEQAEGIGEIVEIQA